MTPVRLRTLSERPMSVLVLADLALVFPVGSAEAWEPAPSPLTTPWSEEVDPTNPLPEYPRPQMVRDSWLSLNGVYTYNRKIPKLDLERVRNANRSTWVPNPPKSPNSID